MSDGEYRSYLDRASRELGQTDVGGYGKYRGRLVKKLDAEAFAERWQQYQQAKQAYDHILAQGDTVNDAIVQMINEHAAELLLDF